MRKYTFSVSVAQDKYIKYRQQLEDDKALTPGELQGTLPENRGVVLSFQVVNSTQDNVTIVFTVESKPFLIPESMIESEVAKLINS